MSNKVQLVALPPPFDVLVWPINYVFSNVWTFLKNKMTIIFHTINDLWQTSIVGSFNAIEQITALIPTAINDSLNAMLSAFNDVADSLESIVQKIPVNTVVDTLFVSLGAMSAHYLSQGLTTLNGAFDIIESGLSLGRQLESKAQLVTNNANIEIDRLRTITQNAFANTKKDLDVRIDSLNRRITFKRGNINSLSNSIATEKFNTQNKLNMHASELKALELPTTFSFNINIFIAAYATAIIFIFYRLFK